MLSRYAFEFDKKDDDQNGYGAINPSTTNYNFYSSPLYELKAGAVNMTQGALFYVGVCLWHIGNTAKASDKYHDVWASYNFIYGAHTSLRDSGNSLRA